MVKIVHPLTALSIASCAICAAGCILYKPIKPFWISLGLVSSVAGICSNSKEFRETANTAIFMASELWQEPICELPTVHPLQLNQAAQSHHLLIIGDTGAGKSTLVMYLTQFLPGQTYIIDPHAKPDDWQGFPVIGRGRDYTTIATVMTSHLEEMHRRYDLRSQGKPYGEPINIVCDEFASIAMRPETKHIADEWFQTLGCEARKVKMKLVLLSQGENAKVLNLEGKTELKSNMAIVRLGKSAIKHCKKLKDDSLINWLTRQPRPAMFDDSPLAIPNLTTLPAGDVYVQNQTVDVDVTESDTEEIFNLTEEHQRILEYCQGKDWVTPSQVKSGVRFFRTVPSSQIKGLFLALSENGYGECQSSARGVKFRVN